MKPWERYDAVRQLYSIPLGNGVEKRVYWRYINGRGDFVERIFIPGELRNSRQKRLGY